MRVLNDFRASRLGVRSELSGVIYPKGSPEFAAQSLVLSSMSFKDVPGWGLSDAHWDRDVALLIGRSAPEVVNLENNILGKLGNPEAEDVAAELYQGWKDQLDLGEWGKKNPPSLWAQGVAKFNEFVSDFKEGASEAWLAYSDYALEVAGPVLESYWTSVSKINALKKDLNDAIASGNFQKDATDAQAGKIAEAEARVDAVRKLYKNVSGGSIDEVAQKAYGKYELSGLQALALPPTLVIGIVAVAFTVYLLSSNMDALKPLFTFPKTVWDYATDPKNKSTIALFAVVVIAVFVIPPLLKD